MASPAKVVPFPGTGAESPAPYDAPIGPPPDDDGPGGGDGGAPPPPGSGGGDEGADRFGRVVPLGTRAQRGATSYVFLDTTGAEVTLTARDMHALPVVSGLFGGASARAFLAGRWPYMRARRDSAGRVMRDEEGDVMMVPSGDFSARDLGDALMAACTRIGPADALEYRLDGIWHGAEGGLVVHTGDAVFTAPEGRRHAPGWRLGKALHIAAAPRAHPAPEAATAAECLGLVQRFSLWSYAPASQASAPAILAGTIAVGILAGALAWRPHVWLRGPTNAGKSSLLDFMVAASGADARSKDVSEAFVRNAFDKRAGLIVMDEEEANLAGVAAVLNLMRGASDGEGARTGRVIDGKAHGFRVACSFLLAAISTPAFEAADASRITTVQLRRPTGGDRQPELRAAVAEARALHPKLSTRLIQGWPRFQANLAAYRGALLGRSATSRCADQLATLLAGWRTLIDDEAADAWTAAEDLNALDLQVITPDQAAESDAPTQVLAHLLSSRVIVGDGRESATVAQVLEALRSAVVAWQAARDGDPESLHHAKADLDKQVRRAGALQIRWQGPARPGVVIGNTSPLLNRCFDGTPWANRVWQQAMRDLPGAEDAGSVKFRGAAQSRAVFVPEAVLGLIPDRPGGPAPAEDGGGDG